MKLKALLSFSLLLSALPLTDIKAEITLPRFISDGMVLQRNDTAHVWGKAEPGEIITVSFLSKKYRAVTDQYGDWIVSMPTTSQKNGGGPYTMQIGDRTLRDIYIGDVWLCSGQSNMDLHTARLEDLYKDEFARDRNPAIHLMQTGRNPTIDGPQFDTPANGYYPWQALTPENVGHWSGISYFYAKEMYKRTGVPQGIINCSMGGSDIVAWMSTRSLRLVAPRYVDDLEHLRQPGYKERLQKLSAAISRTYEELLADDPGYKEGWMEEKYNDSSWKNVSQSANMIYEENEHPWCGSLWMRKLFNVPEEWIGQDSLLRLGCMVDADETYINGVKVGETTYQYPPRKYKIPAGTLHAGFNVICIRLRTNGGGGKFVQDKPYCLLFKGGQRVNLESGMWKVKPGVMMPRQPGVEGIDNSRASALYDNTIYPIRHFKLAGILWYQGETNAGRPDEYRKLLPAMIKDWRRNFGDVPTVVFGLANYMERHEDPNYNGGWARMREAQRVATESLPKAAFVNMVDLGEWNDIHPLNKKEAAHRAVLQMAKLYLGSKETSEGPTVTSVTYRDGKAHLRFKPGTAQEMEIHSPQQHSQQHPLLIGCGFSIAGADGVYYWASAKIEGEEVIVWNDKVRDPRAVRYAWDDDPIAPLYNKAELPAVPFDLH